MSLKQYGVIGNQSSSAVVSQFGSIDWCCFPFIDSPSHFASLLDENSGGKFQISPQGDFRSEQRYLNRTQVLETIFETPFGRGLVTDWMPLDGGLAKEPILFRKIEVIQGKITWVIQCHPRFEYGEVQAQTESHFHHWVFRGNVPEHLGVLSCEREGVLSLSPTGNGVSGKVSMEAGESLQLSWGWGRKAMLPQKSSSKLTAEKWRLWAHNCPSGACTFAGPWHDLVTRSGLILKLLSSPFSGSVAESITSSMPNLVGGSRNWDYRYAWVRNSSLIQQALTNLGYVDEAKAYFSWISDLIIRDGTSHLQSAYSIDGGKVLPELEIKHLAGYQGSKPVRVGDQAGSLFQLDIYGHLMATAAEYYQNFGDFRPELWRKLCEIADYVCHAWKRPDHGPWGVRSKAEHFTASKVMCWVALDRACWLARMMGEPVSSRWLDEQRILHRTICEQGYDAHQRSFVRSFGDRDLDGANLAIPLFRFLPLDDDRVQGTLDALQTNLSEGVFLYRYRSADGIPGHENPHLFTSLNYVSCLALSGRVDEASDRLAEICSYANPLGIFGEQISFRDGENLGNFPMSSVHTALINASLYVGMARGRQLPTQHLLGMPDTLPKKTAKSA